MTTSVSLRRSLTKYDGSGVKPAMIVTAIAARKTIAVLMTSVAVGGCASWQTADKTQGTVGGAAGGAIAGALVGGPIGAVIGGIGGAFVGHETTGYERTPATTSSGPAPATAPPPQAAVTTPQGPQTPAPSVVTTPLRTEYDSATVRAVQQALNSRGYNAGLVDGQWNTTTQNAVRRFQQGSGLPITGELNAATLSALGVS